VSEHGAGGTGKLKDDRDWIREQDRKKSARYLRPSKTRVSGRRECDEERMTWEDQRSFQVAPVLMTSASQIEAD
jgi:hypothetical protein